MRNLLIALLALLLLPLLPGCGDTRDGKELIVGMELAYPPFETVDDSGNPTGVSPDLAEALGDYLHRKVRIKNIPFDGLIPALKTGDIDLIISSMTRTDERAKSIDFSEPYLSTGLTLLVQRDSPIKSIDDLKSQPLSVAVKKGTTGHTYASQNFDQSNILVLDKETSCVLEVTQGKAAAFLYDQMSTYKNWQKNKDTTRAILAPFQKESWAIGIRQGNDDLKKQVNAFLLDFKAQGGFDRLGEKYLAEEKKAFAEMNFPFYF